ncbi:hypothetical protein TNCV_17921 [Trichonephila clavipes]|nr:hypothetical protein TNCV_17921 [Trichonephila clavipes]
MSAQGSVDQHLGFLVRLERWAPRTTIYFDRTVVYRQRNIFFEKGIPGSLVCHQKYQNLLRMSITIPDVLKKVNT